MTLITIQDSFSGIFFPAPLGCLFFS